MHLAQINLRNSLHHMANMADQSYRSKTLFIRNLAFTTTNEKLSALFEDIGPIKQCFVVKGKDSNCNGFGYVKFALQEDAEKAKDTNLPFLEGRKLFISYADITRKKPRIKRKHGKQVEPDSNESNDDEPEIDKDKEPKSEAKINSLNRNTKYLQAKIVVFTGFDPQFDIDQVRGLLSNVKNIANIVYPVQDRAVNTAFLKFKCVRDAKKARKKIREKVVPGWNLSAELLSTESVQACQSQKNLKRSRLIIRNLPFSLKEEELESKFEEFGEVTEIKIPTKSNGKKMGFGFVQFSQMEGAEKAISGMNGKKMRGRILAVDWALSKNDFEAVRDQEVELSEEKDSDNSDSSSEDDDTGYADSDSCSDLESSEDNDTHSSDEEDASSDADLPKTTKSKPKSKRLKKSDVGEGKTLFIRNVPFNCEEEDLQDVLADFGSIVYCKLVVDPLTQHSKGTAFVKFSSMEDAEMCLSQAEDCSKEGGLVLMDRPLKVSRAVDRNTVKDLGKDKEEKVDKRNLFLVREGLVREGTDAAQGLSKVDLAKRAKIELEMRQKLKNPNIFVSSTRLCVQNLPMDLDDKTLKKIMLEAAGDKKANITECRIMRDLQRISCKEGKAVGKSRGFGFVEFSEHQHALNALRSANNRQENDKHMIVHFSLEDQKKLVARRKNIEKYLLQQSQSKAIEKRQSQKEAKAVNVKKRGKRNVQDGIARTIYTGPTGLPSHSGAKVRHKSRKGQGQKGNVQQKKGQGQKGSNQQKTGQGQKGSNQQKKGAKRTSTEAFSHDHMEPVNKKHKSSKHGKGDGFDKLVESYKKKIVSPCPGKWFD